MAAGDLLAVSLLPPGGEEARRPAAKAEGAAAAIGVRCDGNLTPLFSLSLRNSSSVSFALLFFERREREKFSHDARQVGDEGAAEEEGKSAGVSLSPSSTTAALARF